MQYLMQIIAVLFICLYLNVTQKGETVQKSSLIACTLGWIAGSLICWAAEGWKL